MGAQIWAGRATEARDRDGVIRRRRCIPGYVSLPFNRGGFRAINERPESFRVTLVLPGSPAAQAGIERDDQIVAIDGTSAAQMSGRDFTHKLVQPVGTDIALTLRRGNDEREARMRLIEMLS